MMIISITHRLIQSHFNRTNPLPRSRGSVALILVLSKNLDNSVAYRATRLRHSRIFVLSDNGQDSRHHHRHKNRKHHNIARGETDNCRKVVQDSEINGGVRVVRGVRIVRLHEGGQIGHPLGHRGESWRDQERKRPEWIRTIVARDPPRNNEGIAPRTFSRNFYLQTGETCMSWDNDLAADYLGYFSDVEDTR